MAARQLVKVSPKVLVRDRLLPYLAGTQRRIPPLPYLTGDGRVNLNFSKNEDEIWGKSISDLWKGKIEDNGDQRWITWTESSHKLWNQKNEEQQRRDLQVRWSYLRDYLHDAGFETQNHRPLLTIKSSIHDKQTIVSTIGSPDTGLQSMHKLVLDRGRFCWLDLPKQAVNGMLCFITSNMGEFLTYNPSTGERSPWIETTPKANQGGGENRLRVDCIELGFDPVSNQHKIICISSPVLKKYPTDKDGWPLSSDQQLGAEDQIVEVLTVGENIWRRIHAVPPYRVGNGYEEVARPVHIDGNMYWRFRYTSKGEVIMGFDFQSEEFRVIPIPDLYIDKDPEDDYKPFQSVELMEIDGRIAVVDSMWSYENCVRVMHEDASGNIKWKAEDIYIPYTWNVKRDPSVVALTGTNQVFIQPEYPVCVFYYNRNTKKYVQFPVSPDRDLLTRERILQL